MFARLAQRGHIRRSAALILGMLVLGSTAATPASAASTVSQSTAAALEVSTLSVPLIPVSAATNTGAPSTVTSSVSSAIPLLPGESLANTGVYAQTAIANADATSAACAGVVGSGGGLTLGQGGTCTPSTTAGPLLINLPSVSVAGTGFTLQLSASSIYAVCSAGGASGPTAQSTLANVVLTATPTVFGIPGPPISIPINLNQAVSIPAPLDQVLSLSVNQVSTTATTSSATALHIGLGPNSSVLSLDIGKVACGPNAPVAATPLVPIRGIPVVVVVAAVFGAAGLLVRRRRVRAAA